MTPAQDHPADAPLFEALIVPHRSLSARGMWRLTALIGGLGVLLSLRFWLIGAWPVTLFSVAELGLAVALLWISNRAPRGGELILLMDSAVRIVRTSAAGKREERVLPSAWLKVVLEERPGRAPGLLLVARGVREEVGTTLGEAERRDLARALSEAMHRARNPRFNNPQLQIGLDDKILR